MKMKNIQRALGISLILAGGTMLVVLVGCQTQPTATNTEATQADASAVQNTDEAQADAGSGKGAAQMWSENCGRCHNSRSPASYSDVNWDLAGQHMRHQARLTAEEYRQILKFLKAGN